MKKQNASYITRTRRSIIPTLTAKLAWHTFPTPTRKCASGHGKRSWTTPAALFNRRSQLTFLVHNLVHSQPPEFINSLPHKRFGAGGGGRNQCFSLKQMASSQTSTTHGFHADDAKIKVSSSQSSIAIANHQHSGRQEKLHVF